MHTLDIYAGITNHVFMEYLMAWINVHATISKKKKISLRNHICNCCPSFFWNTNMQPECQWVPVYPIELRSADQNPPFQILHVIWSCPENVWRFPGKHMWPLDTPATLSSRTSLCFSFLAVQMESNVKLAPVHHPPKAAWTQDCFLQQ